jgi:hypothetical protein
VEGILLRLVFELTKKCAFFVDQDFLFPYIDCSKISGGKFLADANSYQNLTFFKDNSKPWLLGFRRDCTKQTREEVRKK